jgi:hypothetical protein
MSPTTITEAKSNRDERLQRAHALLAEGVGRLTSDLAWQDLLVSLARARRLGLGRLSFRNQWLVILQQPSAEMVATFRGWQRAGRVVRRGEKALWILAPVIVKRANRKEDDESSSVLVGFRPMAVFSGQQTDRLPGPNGRPLPEPPKITRDVTTPDGFTLAVNDLRDLALGLGSDVVTGITVRPRQPGDHPEAHGWYVPSSKEIVVISGETSTAQQVKTLCHELAHAILHRSRERTEREVEEVEAESTAFVVMHALNVACDGYSFPYIAHWAGGNGKDAQSLVMKSGARIVKAAGLILDKLLGPSVGADENEKEAA